MNTCITQEAETGLEAWQPVVGTDLMMGQDRVCFETSNALVPSKSGSVSSTMGPGHKPGLFIDAVIAVLVKHPNYMHKGC